NPDGPAPRAWPGTRSRTGRPAPAAPATPAAGSRFGAAADARTRRRARSPARAAAEMTGPGAPLRRPAPGPLPSGPAFFLSGGRTMAENLDPTRAALPLAELSDGDLECVASGKIVDGYWGPDGWGWAPYWGWGPGPGWGWGRPFGGGFYMRWW